MENEERVRAERRETARARASRELFAAAIPDDTVKRSTPLCGWQWQTLLLLKLVFGPGFC